MQSAVYLARAAKGGGGQGSRLRQLHAPARRLARTTISLGPEEGIMFGLRSIRCVNMERVQYDEGLARTAIRAGGGYRVWDALHCVGSIAGHIAAYC